MENSTEIFTDALTDKTILIIEDEQTILDIIKFNLEKNGFKTIEATDGIMGLTLALSESPDLILLDVMLPRLDGFEVCRRIREKNSIPIIMLTAREDEVDKVLGLELGADDYITKPFSMRELSARIKANLRRTAVEPKHEEPQGQQTRIQEDSSRGRVVSVDDIQIYVDRFEVLKNGRIIDVTLREFELLKFLCLQPNRIFSRESLLANVWGYEYVGDARTVDVTIRRLREKIENDPSQPRYIMTKRGLGYFFNG